MLSLIAVAMIVLMGLPPARQAWLTNAWSLQYAHRAFSLPAEQSAALPDPLAGHARSALWLASAAGIIQRTD